MILTRHYETIGAYHQYLLQTLANGWLVLVVLKRHLEVTIWRSPVDSVLSATPDLSFSGVNARPETNCLVAGPLLHHDSSLVLP